MGERDIVISLRDVYKGFGKQEVLEGLDLEVKRGEIFGIVGASGSGKSTLLKIMTGSYLPDRGEVLFEPKDLAGYSLLDPTAHLQSIHKNVLALKRTVGYSAQLPSFYDKLTCKENIDFFGSLYKLPSEILKINAKILLKLVGLDEWRNKLAGELSGGMRKRLDLACALVHDPKILVLDEPTADLDFILREQMWDLIKKIKQKGTTVVMSSHFIDEIEGLCDKIVILNNKKIEFKGSPNELKKRATAGLVVKLKTSDSDYDLIKDVVQKKYSKYNIEFNDPKLGEYLKIVIKGLTSVKKEAPKVLQLIESKCETVIEFSYSREGISEMFKELRERRVCVKDDTKYRKYFWQFWRKKEPLGFSSIVCSGDELKEDSESENQSSSETNSSVVFKKKRKPRKSKKGKKKESDVVVAEEEILEKSDIKERNQENNEDNVEEER